MLLWNHREQECVILKPLCGIFQLEFGVYTHSEEKKGFNAVLHNHQRSSKRLSKP